MTTRPGPPSFAPIPRGFPGATIACLGSGPSLCRDDVAQLVAADVKLVAINDAYRLAPSADLLFASDARWWGWHKGVSSFAGLKFSIDRTDWPGVHRLRNAGLERLETVDPAAVGTGYTSGYAAINVAVHLGAARIVLVGYDMQGTHFFGTHPNNTTPPFVLGRKALWALVEPLAALGIEIVNASRETTVTAFRRASLADVLSTAVPS